MKPKPRLLLLFLLLVSAVACSLLSPLASFSADRDPVSSLVAETVKGQVLPSPTPTPPPSDVPPTPAPCGYVWASILEKDGSAKLQSALAASEFPGVVGHAMAYGENCVREDGLVDHFSIMQTDFYFSLPVQDLNDRAALGNEAGKLVALLQTFPKDTFQGPNKGYLSIEFASGEQKLNLWFKLEDAEKALAEGLTGADLFKRLKPGE